MNTNTQTTNPYARQRGFFGSVKDLGTTTVKGTGLVVNDVVTIATDVTGSTATGSTSTGTGILGSETPLALSTASSSSTSMLSLMACSGERV